jgi:hypothetical protein
MLQDWIWDKPITPLILEYGKREKHIRPPKPPFLTNAHTTINAREWLNPQNAALGFI